MIFKVTALTIATGVATSVLLVLLIIVKGAKDEIKRMKKSKSYCSCTKCYHYDKRTGKCDILERHPEWEEDPDNSKRPMCMFNLISGGE